MRMIIRIAAYLALTALPGLWTCALAQADRSEVRAGNRKFSKDNYKEAEIDYRRALVKDSLSVAGAYNLASSLYRQEDYEGAGKALEKIEKFAPQTPHAADYHYNAGDVALARKDYAAAVKAFRESLLLNPGDLDAKENYIYAKKMLENQQNQQNQQDQNQDQQNQQNQQQNQQDQQDQQKDQQDQQKDQQQDKQDQQQQEEREQQISPQQARQMLNAIQAKEKETQDKVKREEAERLKSRQKEKNW